MLVIEDDAPLAEMVELSLSAAGLRVTTVGDGPMALELATTKGFDLIVLDLMLPGIDGLEICRRVRACSNAPVLIVTARASTRDVVLGLETGADDYVTKPFEVPELLARVRAALRRTSEPLDEVVVAGPLTINARACVVHRCGTEIHLSSTEYRLLLELVRGAGQVLTREALLRRVWDYDYLGDSRLVDMAIKRLRDKVEGDSREPRHIITVRGMGYRFDAT